VGQHRSTQRHGGKIVDIEEAKLQHRLREIAAEHIRVGRRCKAKDVVAVLEEITSLYPAQTYIRSDNGPEFIAHALRHWCNSSGTNTA
jgi:hypothetical protein